VEMTKGKPKVHTGSARIDLRKVKIQPEAQRFIPEEMARRYNVMPLRIEGDFLVVAMSQPGNLLVIDEIQSRSGMRIMPLRAALMDVQGAINLHYRSVSDAEREIQQIVSTEPARVPATRIVDLLITGAVKDGASDIHIEPQHDHLRIRYRINGHLHSRLSLPTSIHTSLLARLKVLAKMDIAEKRRP